MVALKIYAALLVVLASFTAVSYGQGISPRMLNGIPADTMRRFPHNVYIQSSLNGLDIQICAGSILNQQWILTSLLCVEQGDTLKISFEKLWRNNTVGSYSAVVNNDDNSVFKYPTGVDNIALIKIPLFIQFSNTVRPISLYSGSPAQMVKKLVVLPGFDTNEDNPSSQKGQLTYAMLNIARNEDCQNSYQNAYDEFLNICAKPNNQNRNTPCPTESGSGLIVGWPAKPQLIGTFSSMSNGCDPYNPFVFTNIEKYLSWINSIIGEQQLETTTYYTTYAV